MASIGTTGRPHATLSRVAALALFLSMAAFWGWAFLIYDAPGNPDRLEDRSWVATADQRCSLMALAVGDLPAAADSASPAHRADVLDDATDLLDQLVADLRSMDGGTTDDLVLVAGMGSTTGTSTSPTEGSTPSGFEPKAMSAPTSPPFHQGPAATSSA